MPAYEIRWKGARSAEGDAYDLGSPQVVRADDWMDALGKALGRYGLGQDTLERAVCLLHRDGTIDVADPDSNTRFEVRQVEGDSDAADLPSLDSSELFHELQGFDAPEPRHLQAFQRLSAMTPDALKALSHDLDELPDRGSPEDRASAVVDILLRHVPAESASVLQLDAPVKRMRFLAVRGPAADALRGVSFPAGRGIAGVVLRTGTSLLVREVHSNPDHYDAIDEAVGYSTRTLLAVPYRHGGQPRGVIELINPFGGGSFTESHRYAAELTARKLEWLLA